MSTYKCPYCETILLDNQNCRSTNFGKQGTPDVSLSSALFVLRTYFCPQCKKTTILFDGLSGEITGYSTTIIPKSLAKQFPDYIPQQIREDYEEAYSIVNLSPKASATLSRRCLQGMIHDFWNVHEKNLNAEITALKDKVSTSEWSVLNSIRQLGNIGAHMEHDINLIVDIDPDEAVKLLAVIEHFIDKWYVSRNNTELLFNEVIGINDSKQKQRNP
ncbi:MAG: DUF4145 domain-containing protein [Clostridia bacterium]|nr:DUF4145 domain-containing protein [Clostridia bacterium]